jgi:hypothetical protein
MSNSKLQKLSVKFFNDALRFMELSKQLVNPEDRGFQKGFLCDYGHLLLMPWAKSFHVLSAGEAHQFLDHVNIVEFLQACVQAHIFKPYSLHNLLAYKRYKSAQDVMTF